MSFERGQNIAPEILELLNLVCELVHQGQDFNKEGVGAIREWAKGGGGYG